jgi:V8-like Glu-specific endopeptidase
LEKKIRAIPFVDIARWRARLGEIEMQVCRVESPGSVGTGFLVGADSLLTNYHVMKEVINGEISPSSVVLRFDYKRSDDGSTIHPGTVFCLSPKVWLIDSSPYSKADELDESATEPSGEELDFVLVRVDGEPGNHPISAKSAESGAPVRGFIRFPVAAVDLAVDAPVLIVQHPKGEPLKLAVDTTSIMRVNRSRTRVRYRTNTEAGSSGSPVFDVNWNLIALHHAGDPDASPAALARWNQGIPIDTIATSLRRRGLIQ